MFVEEKPGGEVSLPETKTDEQRILLRAAELLEEKGWTRGMSEDAMGRMCVGGAINKAFQEFSSYHGRHSTSLAFNLAQVPFANAVRRLEAIVGDSCVQWNDQKGRTVAEAIAALRKAAE